MSELKPPDDCYCDSLGEPGSRCHICQDYDRSRAVEAATAELQADRDVLREALRTALNEAHVYRDTLNAVRERCNTLIAEARTARAAERNARAIIAAAIEWPTADLQAAVLSALRVMPDGPQKELLANAIAKCVEQEGA